MASITAKDGKQVSLILTTVDHTNELYTRIDKDRSHLKFLPWAEKITEQGLLKFIMEKRESAPKNMLWTIKVDNDLVGCIEFRKDITHTEIGYWIGAEFADKGYMKIAINIGTVTRFMGEKLRANVRADNKASMVVLESAFYKDLKLKESGWVTYERTV